MNRIIFLTGRPGIGKTTALKNIVSILREKGYVVGGIITSEVREAGRRIGFEITNLMNNRKGWLANLHGVGPRLGKYRVNLKDLVDVGVNALEEAIKEADVIVIDEIGPMELFSEEFKKVVEKALESGKPLVGTIHFRAKDPLIEKIRKNKNVKILEVTLENRRFLHWRVAELLGLT